MTPKNDPLRTTSNAILWFFSEAWASKTIGPAWASFGFESTVGAHQFIDYVERLYVGWEENHHAFAMQQNST